VIPFGVQRAYLSEATPRGDSRENTQTSEGAGREPRSHPVRRLVDIAVVLVILAMLVPWAPPGSFPRPRYGAHDGLRAATDAMKNREQVNVP
jgi:hypothetical protein